MSVKFFDLASAAVARQSDEIGDPAATRTVYIVTIALVAIGVALVVLAVWLFRATRPDPQLLAPLETMERRGWRRLGQQDRRRALDEVRPPGAAPIEYARRQPDVFEEFGHVRAVTGFADLADTARPSPSDPLVIDTVLADPTLLAPPMPDSVAVSEPVPSTPLAGVDAHADERAADIDDSGDIAEIDQIAAAEDMVAIERVEPDSTPHGFDRDWPPLDPLTVAPLADVDVAPSEAHDGDEDDAEDQREDQDDEDEDDEDDDEDDDEEGEPLMPGEGLLRRRPGAR